MDKVYVHTAKDQVVSPSLQAIMVAATPVRREFTVDTGHTPFLTDPHGLARDIEIAAEAAEGSPALSLGTFQSDRRTHS